VLVLGKKVMLVDLYGRMWVGNFLVVPTPRLG